MRKLTKTNIIFYYGGEIACRHRQTVFHLDFTIKRIITPYFPISKEIKLCLSVGMRNYPEFPHYQQFAFQMNTYKWIRKPKK